MKAVSVEDQVLLERAFKYLRKIIPVFLFSLLPPDKEE